MSGQLKVLLSAYACEPGKGSEPGVGWNWVKAISQFAEVWVITRANNRPAIEKALEMEPLPNVHWVYFDLPHWARFWKKGQRGVHFYYYLWQIGIYFIARQLHRGIGFDLVHHLTFGNYWLPSFLVFLPLPFVFGPVGGGETAPRSFYRTYSKGGKLKEFLRDTIRFLSDFNPLHRKILKKCTLILATTKQTLERLRKLGVKKVQVIPQFAMTTDDIRKMNQISLSHLSDKVIRFISAGRNVHWKGFHLGIMAFSRAIRNSQIPMEYWIVNTGPEHQHLRTLARKLNLEDKVFFWGKLPTLMDVYIALSKCHVLVHPALHEAFGNIVLEAMALGKPVICLDLGGPALQVTQETGFKIPAHTPEQAIEDMARAMWMLAEDPDLRRRMGESARQRVREHFNWEQRREQIAKIYRDILSQ